MNARHEIQVWAPSALEYLTARVTIGRGARYAGIGLKRLQTIDNSSPVILCGLAGALTDDMAIGTVFIPTLAASADGNRRVCDPLLASHLTSAARALGFETETGSLFTADHIVTGDERTELAKRDFVAADMESALLPGRTFAVVRVILDTPSRPISRVWEQPARAMISPRSWKELSRLTVSGPIFSLRAARVVRTALKTLAEAEPR